MITINESEGILLTDFLTIMTGDKNKWYLRSADIFLLHYPSDYSRFSKKNMVKVSARYIGHGRYLEIQFGIRTTDKSNTLMKEITKFINNHISAKPGISTINHFDIGEDLYLVDVSFYNNDKGVQSFLDTLKIVDRYISEIRRYLPVKSSKLRGSKL